MVAQKRFALFLAMPDSEFAIKTYGGYFNVFKSLLGDEGEEWDLYRVYEGVFPEEKDFEKYDGFVISGSPSDSFLDLDWILKLCDIIKKLDEMKKKMLGICFGHQVIARALGGESGRARNGHTIGLGSITIIKEALSPENYFGDEIPASLRIVKAHRDEVLELPENAKILAYSEKYDVEMYSIEKHILCVQGHPEYNREILFDIVDRVHSQGHVPKEYADATKATMEKNDADRTVWQKVFKKFLKD